MRVALIPLAGKGQRFKDEGYNIPKPFITVGGVPMVVAAAKSLPKCDKYIFICLKEHMDRYHVSNMFKNNFPNSEIIVLDKVTQGQASTCLLAEKYINPQAELIIGACDNGMKYSRKKFNQVFKYKSAGILIFTFRNNPNVLNNPTHWGWMETRGNNEVENVSVKKPISDNLMKDHAIVGTFAFKKAKYFFDSARQLIRESKKINGEFYVDSCMSQLIGKGLKVRIFEIEKYIGWGTPVDLKTYEYWKAYFKNRK